MLKGFAYSASLVWGEVCEQVKYKVAPVLDIEAYTEAIEVQLCSFLTSVVDGGDWSPS